MGVKTSIKIDGLMVLIGAGVLGAVYIASQKEKISAALDKVNPASENNFVYQGTSKIVQAATMSEADSVGDLIYKTRYVNPIAWIFEGVGRITGDLP